MLVVLFVFSGLFIIQPMIIKPVSATWWDSDYNYYITCTIDGSYIANTLTNFPVLVVINTTIGSLCDGGNSIRFLGQDNSTTYPYSIDFWNASGNSYVWVNITTVNSGTNTTFLMYYNNSGASDGQTPTSVWDSNYVMVQHMKDATTSTITDSTGNFNNGTKKGANEPLENASGYINKAQHFDGVDDFINVTNSSSLYFNTSFTIEALFMTHNISANQRILLKGYTAPTIPGWTLIASQGDALGSFMIGDTAGTTEIKTNTTFVNNTWYYLVGVRDGVNRKLHIYLNGIENNLTVINDVRNSVLSAGNLIFGKQVYSSTSYFKFNGEIDEARISNNIRNDSWILATFHSQNQTTGFMIQGAMQGQNSAPIISDPIPANGSTNILLNLSEVCINISDPEGDLMTVYITRGPPPDQVAYGSTVNGTYCNDIPSNLSYNTTYTWWVNVTDGTSWTNATYIFTTIGNDQPQISLPVPYDAGTDVSIFTQNVSVLIMDNESDLFYAEINCSNGDNWGAEDLADGFYALNLTAYLQQNTTYTWWVNVTDGYSGWNNVTYMFTTEVITFTIENETPENRSGFINYLTEYFENDTLGTDPTESWYNFSDDYPSADSQVSDTYAFDGTQSLRIGNATSGGAVTFTKNTGQPVSMQWYQLRHDWGSSIADSFTLTNGSKWIIIEYSQSSGSIYVYSNVLGVGTALYTFSMKYNILDIWYKTNVTFNWSAHKFRVEVDNGSASENSTWLQMDYAMMDVTDFIIQSGISMGTTYPLYIDSLLLGEAIPPPVSVWLQNWTALINSSIGLFNYTITTNHYNYTAGENNTSNGTKILNITDKLLYNDTVVIFVNVSYYGATAQWWFIFITTEGYVPLITDPLPLNATLNVSFTLDNLSVNISDFDNDTLDYTMEMNSFSSSGTLNNTTTSKRIYLTIANLTANATYTWYVNITDGYWTTSIILTFKITQFYVDFTWTIVNLTVHFYSNVSGDLDYYIWNFGDAGFSTKTDPIHTYAMGPENFTVTLTCENANTNEQMNMTHTVPVGYDTSVAGIGQPLLSIDWIFVLYLAIALLVILLVVMLVKGIGSMKNWVKKK